MRQYLPRARESKEWGLVPYPLLRGRSIRQLIDEAETFEDARTIAIGKISGLRV